MDTSLLEEIKLRLDTNRYELKKLDEMYIKAFAPEGYKKGTSYKDYDTIHGSRKEYSIEDFERKRNKLIKAIEYDDNALFNALNEIDVDKYLQCLSTTKLKVGYLKNVVGMSKTEISDKLKLSYRHIQRVYKEV